MIGSLRGRLAAKEAQRVLIETGGVGYLVHVPFSTYFALGDVGSDASLLIHTHVREDALLLFGFATALERTLFERLIAVAGIGPRMAQTILSGMAAPELVGAIRSGDLRRLQTVPGLGKKTSERLVVELRDKLDDIGLPPAGRVPPRKDGHREDAVSALVNLGYRQKDAEQAVDRARPVDGAGLADLLKLALAELAR